MQVNGISENGVLVQLSTAELHLVSNALNEVCHALDRADFSTRLGADHDAAERLLNDIGALCKQIEAAQSVDRVG